jgi:hypothetical protein
MWRINRPGAVNTQGLNKSKKKIRASLTVNEVLPHLLLPLKKDTNARSRVLDPYFKKRFPLNLSAMLCIFNTCYYLRK